MKPKTTLFTLLIILIVLLSCDNEELEDQNNQEFIEYTIDDEQIVTVLDEITASFNPEGVNPWTDVSTPRLEIFTTQYDSGLCFRMTGFLNESDYIGSYLHHQFIDDTGFRLDDFSWFACPDMFDLYTNIDITYNLTSLGDIGEFIDVNFNGSYEDYNGVLHSITGIVHVLRDN